MELLEVCRSQEWRKRGVLSTLSLLASGGGKERKKMRDKRVGSLFNEEGREGEVIGHNG